MKISNDFHECISNEEIRRKLNDKGVRELVSQREINI